MRHPYFQPSVTVVHMHSTALMQAVLTGRSQIGSQQENRAPKRGAIID